MVLVRRTSKRVSGNKKTVDSYSDNGTDTNTNTQNNLVTSSVVEQAVETNHIEQKALKKMAFIKLKGYHQNNDYSTAKQPVPGVKWQNEKNHFESLDHPQLQAWIKKGAGLAGSYLATQ